MSNVISMLRYRADCVPSNDRPREMARLIHCEGHSYAEIIDAFEPDREEIQTAAELISMGDSYFRSPEEAS